MSRWMTCLLTSLAFGALLPARVISGCSSPVSQDGDQAEIPAAKDAKDQAEAIRLARQTDIPAAKRADRLVIQEAGVPIGGGKRVTIDSAEEVGDLSRAQKPKAVPAGGGMTAATFSSYRGDRLIRSIWVFEGGEWGFDRPGTDWTTGFAPELWESARARLQ